MKTKLSTVLIAILIFTTYYSSASPRISLLTCGSGTELYSAFGHSALRINDVDKGYDVVYNFGLFNFSTPNFYAKFIKGDLDYYLGIENFNEFIAEYTYYNRDVFEQELNLSAEQTQSIISELEFLSLPENVAYKYEFIKQNCTTKLRDIIFDNIDADTTNLNTATKESYRDHLNRQIEDKTWVKIGINLILGSRIDKDITLYQRLFLPQQLSLGLENATNGGDKLVTDSHELFAATSSSADTDNKGFIAQNYPYILILVVALCIIGINSRFVNISFYFLLGILGLVIVFLTLYGTHIEFKSNVNLLWCNPLYIVLACSTILKKSKLTFITSGLILCCLCATYILWIIDVQSPDPAYLILNMPILFLTVKSFTKNIDSVITSDCKLFKRHGRHK